MATYYIGAGRTASEGVGHITRCWLTNQSRNCVRLMHLCPAVFQVNSETGQSNHSSKRIVEEDPEEPQYNSKKKTMNPMKKVGYAWMIGLPSGIIGFLLAKRQVDKNRLKQLRIRQRMRSVTEGEYEGSRYSRHAADVSLNR